MIYKLKFEIDYSDMSKDEIRDSKLDEILESDKEMVEVTIDPSIKIPSIGDTVVLDDVDYIIRSNKTKIEKDCYTTIYLVKSVKIIKEEKKKSDESMYNVMLGASSGVSSNIKAYR